MPYQLVQGHDELVPKADIRPHQEIEGSKLIVGEMRKGTLAGGNVDTIVPGVQLEIRKHRGVGVKPRHLRLERLGAVDTYQPPAAAELQHTSLRGNTALLQIVHQQKTRRPDLLPMD